MEEQPKPTPINDAVAALVKFERESGDGMRPIAIRLGRTERGMLNEEMRGRRNFKEITSPDLGENDTVMGTFAGLPVFVVDDRSLIEIVLEKEPEED